MDHLGVHTLYIKDAKKMYAQSLELVTCSPPVSQDPRTHLNGPFVSLRKVQKHLDLGRLAVLENRREKLRKLIECDRRTYQCELLKQGLTLYTDTLL